jgi:hypothetical protein
MSTFLLTWNPRRYEWVEFERLVAASAKGRPVDFGWSCGNNQHIRPGNRVFLLRQGSNSPGILASGWVTKGSYEGRPFDDRVQRKKALYVGVEWEVIVPCDRRLTREKLLKGILQPSLLATRAGGVTIETDEAIRLEKTWAKHLGRKLPIAALATTGLTAWEGAPVEYTGYRRSRDRRLSEQALEASRGVCSCCCTDYSKVLAGDGVHVLQVHHKKQLGYRDKPTLTKQSDLAVVCANCHHLIHMNPKKALSVDALKKRLKKRR